MTRLDRVFALKAATGEKTLALFLTAGMPSPASCAAFAGRLVAAGADIIELGMPFSDPLADGPVIQEASRRALAAGVRLGDVLRIAREIRAGSDAPVVLMGYLNPILRYGRDRFLDDARDAGVDGLILPEVPLEEQAILSPAIAARGLSWIQLVTPSTPDPRVRKIDRASRGFLYCVSLNGVTGAGLSGVDEEYLARVRKCARRNPVLAGFGVGTAEEARAMCRVLDGVVVGSALLKRIMGGETEEEILRWVSGLKQGMRPPGVGGQDRR